MGNVRRQPVMNYSIRTSRVWKSLSLISYVLRPLSALSRHGAKFTEGVHNSVRYKFVLLYIRLTAFAYKGETRRCCLPSLVLLLLLD